MSLPFTVPARTMAGAAQWDKLMSRAAYVPGVVHFVLPTTDYAGYDSDAFVRNVHKYVYSTMDLALAACVAGRGDAIVLLPGAHTPTASLAMSKAGVSIWGPEAWVGYPVQKSAAIVTAPAGDEAINFTAEDCALIGVSCVPVTAKSFADFSAAADGLTVTDCYIDLITPVVNIATEGFTCLAAAENVVFDRIYAESDGAQGPAIELNGACVNAKIAQSRFHCNTGSWAAAISLVASAGGIMIFQCGFTCSGIAMTAGVLGSGITVDNGVTVGYCWQNAHVTKMVSGFATGGHCQLVQNYIGQDGGISGGVGLVTLVT